MTVSLQKELVFGRKEHRVGRKCPLSVNEKLYPHERGVQEPTAIFPLAA
jgi:hypothetical protein